MKFTVNLIKTTYSSHEIEVEANTKEEAEKKAIEDSANYDFTEDDVTYSVSSSKEHNKVIIEHFNTYGRKFDLYDEAGHCVESGFDSPKEAEQWAGDNGYEVVESFNL